MARSILETRDVRERRRRVASVIGLATLCAASSAGAASPAGRAVALCHRAAFAEPESAKALIDAGLALAERAVAGDGDDPTAHFALFCNLAKRMHLQGLGLGTLADLRLARAALDRSLELDPLYVDALAAKGALLYYMPRFAGGDVDAGERLIRSALALDPDNPSRLVLVDLLVHRQAVDEARREAVRSLSALHGALDIDARAGARALLAHLCAREWPVEIAALLDAECSGRS